MKNKNQKEKNLGIMFVLLLIYILFVIAVGLDIGNIIKILLIIFLFLYYQSIKIFKINLNNILLKNSIAVLLFIIIFFSLLFLIPEQIIFEKSIYLFGYYIIILIIFWYYFYNLINDKVFILKRVIYLCIIFSVYLFIGELFVRKYINYNFEGVSLNIPHPYLTKSLNPQHSEINSLCFRGEEVLIPKPKHVYRIAFIGGSTTYGSRVKSYRNSYPYLVGKYLKKYDKKVDIVNAGVSHYSTFESLINFEFRVIETQPDLVVIYHAINDVLPRLVKPDFFFPDNRGFRQRWIGGKIKMPYPNFKLFIYIIKKLNLKKLTSYRILRPDVPRYSYEFDPEAYKQIGYTPSELLKHNHPIYYERNIRNIITICLSKKIKVLLLSFAYYKNLNKKEFAWPNYLLAAIDEHNNIIKKVYREYSNFNNKNVYFFDFALNMPQGQENFEDCVHLNAQGNQKKAELIGKFILENILQE